MATVAAGLDIGNATTEAVLAEIHGGRIAILGADRLPTRGPKGSPASLDVGARLVRRLERAYGVRVDELAVAPLRPVTTETLTRPEPTVHTGRLRLVRAGAETAGGQGFGVGAPYLVGEGDTRPPPAGPVVAVVPAGLGYRSALPLLEKLLDRLELAAVVVERDEAVLLANRLPAGLPIVDGIAPGDVLGAALVAVEARGAGQPLTALTDPLKLTAALGLTKSKWADSERADSERADTARADTARADTARADTARADTARASDERADAARLAARLYDDSNAVVALDVTARPPEPEPEFQLPDADDLFSVDLGALADRQLARVGSVASRTVVLAALRRDAPPVDPSVALAERLGVPCRVAPSEALAALHGGRSTPGAPDDAVVVDLGGGTIDVVGPGFEHTVAGAGELLTAATAGVLGSGRTTAEFAKRGPAFRVDGSQVLVAEDGARMFLDAPVPADVIGALVVDGPAGWLAVHRGLAPAEWRALRLRLKAEVLGQNLARALGGQRPASVVVIGGPAGDDEAIGCVARVLPPGTAVGRGDVAGRLGHRYGVAYGLLVASFSVGR